MRKVFFIIMLVSISTTVFSENFYTCYIEDSSTNDLGVEYFLITQIEDEYFVSFIRPTISGRHSLAQYWVGSWNGREIVLDNGYSVYGINKQENGNIFFYVIKDVGEFPGKDFRPLTVDDLKKISDTNKP